MTTGSWFQGEMTGEGTYTHASGEVYKGQVRDISLTDKIKLDPICDDQLLY